MFKEISQQKQKKAISVFYWIHPSTMYTDVYSDKFTYYCTLCPPVPVGGPAMMSYDIDIGDNYAVIGMRLYCQAAKGSHPRYQWFLNQTLLHNQDSLHIVDQLPERSILLLSLVSASAGTYHCQVSDSFDNSTVFGSNKMYIDRKGIMSPCICPTPAAWWKYDSDFLVLPSAFHLQWWTVSPCWFK